MERSEVIEEIKSDLGYPTVKVEIDDVTWDKIFSKALRWYRAKKGHIVTTLVPLEVGRTEYDWPADAYAIQDVVLPYRSDVADILSLGFFDLVPAAYVLGGTSYPAGMQSGTMQASISSYVQMLQMLEMRRRVFSSEPDYMVIDAPSKKIIITTKNAANAPGTPVMSMVVFYKKENVDIPDLIGRDEYIIYKYCLAKAKGILGMIRRKYANYPAAGGAVSMDGADLIAESKEELEKLEEEIDGSQGNYGGIVVG